MFVTDNAPVVSPDGRTVIFHLPGDRSDVECAISRSALETYFWLPADASAERMLKTFVNGQERIIAIAQRKKRARPVQPVRLIDEDFAARR